MFRFCRKKGKFYPNYPVLWAKKVNRYPFLADLKKNYCSHVHILLKNVQSLNNTTDPCRYDIRKTSILSKTRCAYVNFLMKNPLLSYPYLVKKTSSFQNCTIYYLPKNSQNALFCRFFMKSSLISGPYFIKKGPLPKNHTALMRIFCQENVNYPKN